MKTIQLFLLGTLCMLATSCGSNEPDAPYSGPWEIHYCESRVGGFHNNSPEFEVWFLNHTDCFVEFHFQNGNTQGYLTDYIELNDYKNDCGIIYWREIITQATEDEIKSKVAEFESFTITYEKDNNKADLFQAEYQRYDGK